MIFPQYYTYAVCMPNYVCASLTLLKHATLCCKCQAWLGTQAHAHTCKLPAQHAQLNHFKIHLSSQVLDTFILHYFNYPRTVSANLSSCVTDGQTAQGGALWLMLFCVHVCACLITNSLKLSQSANATHLSDWQLSCHGECELNWNFAAIFCE